MFVKKFFPVIEAENKTSWNFFPCADHFYQTICKEVIYIICAGYFL